MDPAEAPREVGSIPFRGQDEPVVGMEMTVGSPAPDFLAVAKDWSEIYPLAMTRGGVRILTAVASLDSSTCDREAKRFNAEAADLDRDITIFVVSMDLPYAQDRWCGAAGVDRVVTVSDHVYAEFGIKYGCLIRSRRLLRRAVFVVDRKDTVRYAAYMPTLAEEPDYEAVLGTARKALGQG
ncbi:MAG TPA: thiol peroxidase [Anaerolineales bacterium]|nr:thiol peroxidase [Anaerolineales bacterium]